MYNIFTNRYTSNNSVIKPPEFELFKRTYKRELDKVVDYYNTRVYAVKSNHLVCRLLQTFSAPFDYDIETYMNVVYSRSIYISKYFNFTSEISYGKIHDGLFYGEGNKEIILYNEDYFNPFESILNWQKLKPIQVLEHNVSNIDFNLLNGVSSSTGEGLCVISINIPMLMLQYRGFVEQQKSRLSEEAGYLGVTHFVNMYVLPGMLESHLDISILNRFKKAFYNLEMSTPTRKLPFLTVDYSSKLDRTIEQILKHLNNTNLLYSSSLKNIPSLGHEDMQEAMMMPDYAKTIQIFWALILSRLNTMRFLIDVEGEKGISNNRSSINKLKIDLFKIRREPVLRSMFSQEMCDSIMLDIDYILEI